MSGLHLPARARQRCAALTAIIGIVATAPVVSGCGGSTSEAVTVRAPGLVLSAALEPRTGRAGDNTIWLELRDDAGAPVEGAQVAVAVRMPSMGAMPAMGGRATVTGQGGGRYRADFALSMGGTWRVEVRVETGQGSLAADGSLTVGSPGLLLESVGPGSLRPGVADVGDPGPNESLVEISVDPQRLQKVGVRIGSAEEQPFDVRVRAVARVSYDETTLRDVSLKVRGWVGGLEADALGVRVERGSILFTVYSPELFAAQQEYLQALASQRAARKTSSPERADYLVRAARKRLRLWDISDADIDRVERGGTPIEYLPVRSPSSGYIIEKNIVEGSAMEPGQRLLRIAPLDRVWLEAEIYESDLSLVEVGQRALVTLPYQPGKSYEGEISTVYPYLEGASRTGRVRIELPNPELELRPDMYANVEILIPRGLRLVVPQSAVLYAGDRRFVFQDLGEGRFRARAVRLGMRSGEEIEILSGLSPGDRIVISGTFLIASESRLQAAIEAW